MPAVRNPSPANVCQYRRLGPFAFYQRAREEGTVPGDGGSMAPAMGPDAYSGVASGPSVPSTRFRLVGVLVSLVLPLPAADLAPGARKVGG
jgi:hypothetical protein